MSVADEQLELLIRARDRARRVLERLSRTADRLYRSLDRAGDRLARLGATESDPRLTLSDREFLIRMDRAREDLEALSRARSDPDVGLDDDEFEDDLLTVHRRLQQLERAEVEPDVGLDMAELRRELREMRLLVRHHAEAADAEIDVTADATGLRGEVTRAAKLAGLGQRATVEVDADTDPAARAVRGLQRMIGDFAFFAAGALAMIKLPALIAGFSALAGAVGALGGAVAGLTTQITPLVGLLAGLPGMLGTIVQGAGGVMLAFQGVGDAVEALGTGDAEKIRDAMRDLSPATRAFAREVAALQPKLAHMREHAARGLFPGLTEALRNLTRLFPVLNRNIEHTNRILGQGAASFAEWLTSARTLEDVNAVMLGNASTLRILLEAVRPLTAAFLNLTIAARPMINWAARGLVTFARWAERTTHLGRESGRLADAFDRTMALTEQWGRILGNLWRMLRSVGQAARDLGGWMMEGMEEATTAWADWAASVEGQTTLRDWFEDMRPTLQAIGNLLGGVAEIIGSLAANQNVADLINQIADEFLPVLGDLFSTVSGRLGPAVVDLVTALTQLFVTFGTETDVLVRFVQVLADLLEAFNDLLERFPQLMEFLVWLNAIRAVLVTIRLGGFITGLSALGGAFKMLKGLGVGSMFMSMGGSIAAGAKTAVTGLGSLLAAIGPAGWITLAVIALAALVVANWDTIKEVTTKAWNATTLAISESWDLAWEWTSDTLSRMGSGISRAWDKIKRITRVFWREFKRQFKSGMRVLLAIMTLGLSEITMWVVRNRRKIQQNITQMWRSLTGAFRHGRDRIVGFVANLVGRVVGGFQRVSRRMAALGLRGVNAVIRFFQRLPGRLVSSISGLGSRLWRVGVDAMRSMVDGLWSQIGRLTDTARRIRDRITARLNPANWFSTPEEHYRELWGDAFGAIGEEARGALRAVDRRVQALRTAASMAPDRATLTAGGREATPLTIVAQIDGRQFARATGRYTLDELRRIEASLS